MTNPQPEQQPADAIPEAVVTTRSGVSIVWLIPLIAALIGGWLAWKAFSEQGPTITISFKSAEGLEAGKTKIVTRTSRSARSRTSNSAMTSRTSSSPRNWSRAPATT